MRKTILNLGIAMLFVVGSATFIGCSNESHEQNETAEEEAMEQEENMEMENKTEVESESEVESEAETETIVYACPMHPEITGEEGEQCSKCGMDLKKVE